MDAYLSLWLYLIPLSVVPGVIASRKGRDGWGFFFLSLVLSPVVGIICALIAEPNKTKLEKKKIKSGLLKRCPYCAEAVKKQAIVCKHCGKDIPITIETKAEASKDIQFDLYEARFGVKKK